MNSFSRFKILVLSFFPTIFCLGQNSNLQLWYNKPAEKWVEALPIGNGRLAAMVFGHVENELIQLNEETLWYGGVVNPNPNPTAVNFLKQTQKALLDNDLSGAMSLCKNMQGVYSNAYAPLADITIKQEIKDKVSDYYRSLDLQKAVATTSFKMNNTTFKRTAFGSAPDQVIVIRMECEGTEKINATINAKSQIRFENEIMDNELILKGKLSPTADLAITSLNNPNQLEPNSDVDGMRYHLRAKVVDCDGKIVLQNNQIGVKDAKHLTLIISAGTSFNGFDKSPVKEGRDEKLISENWLKKAEKKSYNSLLNNHILEYQSYFNRLKLNLNTNSKNIKLPTDERLKLYSDGAEDNNLESLIYQFGRYLLISSSRPGGIPANLQGKWNAFIRPPWNCNFTTNINVQMNYWAAETVNLTEMQDPLIKQISNMSASGTDVAKNFFNCRGWAAGHNSDIWATTNPVGGLGGGDPHWANWVMAGAWLSEHLWEKYRFNQDVDYLKNTAYPIMKNAALFFHDFLIDDKNGRLVTAPSTSPENQFFDENGQICAVSVASTADMSMIRELFTNVISASTVLNVDNEFRETTKIKLSKLLPLQISKNGYLQEWSQDFKELDPQHRHLSHLYGLHPGNEISPYKTPEFFDAVKKSLELRGDGGTGWSRAWKISLWARLHDGNHAYRLIRNALSYTTVTDFTDIGGMYPNLFTACPPFQIDANFGILEGISEMLIQSQWDDIELLPALPTNWKCGDVSGLVARNGFVVSMNWDNNVLTKGSVHSKLGQTCTLRTNVPLKIEGVNVISKKINSKLGVKYITEFQTEKNKIYNFESQK